MRLSLVDLGVLPVLSHAGPGASSVTDPARLPLDNLIEPRTLVPCRFTTTAVTTDAAPNNRLLLSYDFGKGGVTDPIIGVLGHNLSTGDEFMVSVNGGAFTNFDLTMIDFNASGPVFAAYSSKKSAFVFIPGGVDTLVFRFAAGGARINGTAPLALEIGRIWVGRGLDYSEQFGAAWSMRLIDGGRTDLSRVGGMFFSPATVLRELTFPMPAMDRFKLVPNPYLDTPGDPKDPTWLNLVRAAGMTREIICMPRETAAAWPRERMSVYGLLSASPQVSQQGLGAKQEEYYSGQLTLLERR